MLTVEIFDADLERKAAQLRTVSKSLQRRVVKAADGAVQESYLPALQATVPEFIPSGFAPTLAAGLKVDTSVSFAGNPGVTAKVSAPTGKPKGRAVVDFERGRLKHPLFGNRSHWYTTRMKPGFAKAALRSTKTVIVRAIDRELEEIKRELS